MPENPFAPHESDDNTPEALGVGSLSDYIARHLRQRNSAGSKANTSPETSGLFRQESHPPALQKPSAENTGMILHHLDSQLANNHLERYLPTASTRYHLARQRISKELDEVYDALKHYRQFHGNEYHTKIEALEKRASLLKRKLFELDRNIAKLNPFQSMYMALRKFPLKPPVSGPKKPGWMLIPNPNRQIREEVSAISQELESIQHMLSEQLHDPSLTPQQLGRLVNEYDINLRKAEALMQQLQSRKSLGSKLGDTFSQWYQQFSWHKK